MFHVFHTHVAEACFQMLFSVLCCIHVTSVSCCSAGDEPGAGGRTGVLRSGHTRGVLVLSCSSRFLSAARAKREEGVRAIDRRKDGGRMRAWGRAKVDGGRASVVL